MRFSRTLILMAAGVFTLPLPAQRFYPDDPLLREPRPLPITGQPQKRTDYEVYDFYKNTFRKPGQRNTDKVQITAKNINTLGDVPDSPWYENRHGKRAMSIAELVRGPGNENGPAAEGPLRIVGAKTEGITPGFQIVDAKNRRYLMKFDPPRNPEIASGADVVGSKFFYALGYHVPENYIIYFPPSRLTIDPKATIEDVMGKRPLAQHDIDRALEKVKKDADGRVRALASLFLKGAPLGPFRYYGMRGDDPNDIVLHEHRRELRGLFVFAAWLNHTDTKSGNTLDMLVEDGGVRHIKHHLIDFGASLGSGTDDIKRPEAGHEHFVQFKSPLIQMATLGFLMPRWAFADFADLPAVGRFQAETFEPDEWKSNYPNVAFYNRLPEDTYWAAKQVMKFTDEEIRALVRTGVYSDPAAVDWLVKTLAERRDKIGRAYLEKALPLDDFRITKSRLEFEDLGVKHKLANSRAYTIQWTRYDNQTGQHAVIPEAISFELPGEIRKALPGSYYAARIFAGDTRRSVLVYLTTSGADARVVGVERKW